MLSISWFRSDDVGVDSSRQIVVARSIWRVNLSGLGGNSNPPRTTEIVVDSIHYARSSLVFDSSERVPVSEWKENKQQIRMTLARMSFNSLSQLKES